MGSVIYDAKGGGGGKNERDSADVWLAFAQEAEVEEDRVRKVYDYIVFTAKHTPEDVTYVPDVSADVGLVADPVSVAQGTYTDDNDLALFLDFDMAVLAWPTDSYLEYAQQIRVEYAHISDPDFRTGRSAFLRGTLGLNGGADGGGDGDIDPKPIYITPDFVAQHPQAYANMNAELSQLSQ